MKVLGGKGLVESRTRAGARVRPREAWHLMDPDVLDWRYQTAPTLADLEDLAGLRVALEPGAARLAAGQAAVDGIRNIEEALGAMRATLAGPESLVEADLAFHTAVFQASGNALLIHLHKMMAIALAAVRQCTRVTLSGMPYPSASMSGQPSRLGATTCGRQKSRCGSL